MLQTNSPTAPQSDPLGLTPLPIENRERFLRFMLSPQHDGLLPLQQISEVMQLTLADIVPVPDMPPCTLGICSWRGATLWLIDLAHVAGASPLYARSQPLTSPTVIVVQHDGRSLGLIIEKIGDVELLAPDNWYQAAGLCPASLEPYVMGHRPKDKEGQGGVILNVPALLASSSWHSLLAGTS